MDRDQANVLIDYIEALEQRTRHQDVMNDLSEELGLTAAEIDAAARALGKIAGRDFGIL